MYSKRVEDQLKKRKLRVGTTVRVTHGDRIFEGILMPKTDSGDPDCLVLKMDNGYNIGIHFDSKTKITRSEHKSPRAVREEEEFELGKVKKSLLKLKFDEKKPPVSLVATGGTIGSRIDYETGGVTGLMDPKEFLHNVPELGEIINLKTVSPFTKMSEDLDSADWQVIAKACAKEINSGRNVIVAHGTDTLHYTSAALSFMLKKLTKPVVVVGAQRSSDRGSSDAGMNLICAAYAATGKIAGVNACMHGSMSDDYCLLIRGTRVRKMHTSRRDAFRPINDLPLARIYPDGKTDVLDKNHTRVSDGRVELDTRFQPKIALIKTFPGSDPGVMDYYLDKGYKGFVVEGTGLGHVPTLARRSWIPKIKKTVSAGIPVVVTSQTLYGRVHPDVYTNLRRLFHDAGAISGEDMFAETAYVKLGVGLAHVKGMDKLKEFMHTNLVGETNPRSLQGTFLY